ncbi:Phosphatidic acid phosphatase type 2/haloperoxidase [Trinorchestia longiramus]|nr:Phosphatidic acid phosphatase type 2/haloperoxidase [Trinorchestia longiramus]
MALIDLKYGIRICVDFTLLLIVGLVLLVGRKTWVPPQRGFFCGDTSIQYPFVEHETIGDSALLGVGVLLPVAMHCARVGNSAELISILDVIASATTITTSDSLILGKVCMAVPILIYYLLGKPFERGFYCSDDSIRYPYKDSTVSTLALYLVGTLLPFFAMLVLEWVRCRTGDVGKRVYIDCGEPGNYKYVIPECHPVDDFRLKEARLSFPSGHASFSAFTMIYLVLYLQARLRVRMRLVRPVLQFVCVLLAFYTALSRVSDYKHHWSDVLFGSLLGTTVAVLVGVGVTGFFDSGELYGSKILPDDDNYHTNTSTVSEMQNRRGRIETC